MPDEESADWYFGEGTESSLITWQVKAFAIFGSLHLHVQTIGLWGQHKTSSLCGLLHLTFDDF